MYNPREKIVFTVFLRVFHSILKLKLCRHPCRRRDQIIPTCRYGKNMPTTALVMSMSAHVTSLLCNLTYHLRNITRIRRFMEMGHMQQHCWLPHIVKIGLWKRSFAWVQRLIHQQTTKVSKLGSQIDFFVPQNKITPLRFWKNFIGCLWRSVSILKFCFMFTNAWMDMHRTTYLVVCHHILNLVLGLRSALDTTRLAQPNISSKSLWSAANKAFSLAAPALWNQLPIAIRSSNSLNTFKKALKSHLYPQ